MTYAFVLDASACSGCKACQVACKDKNRLPLGVLWRRVYEVSGGSWKQEGAAWTSTVFCLQPFAGVQPLRPSQVRGRLPGECLYGPPGRHRHTGFVQVHRLRILCLGLSLWRAAIRFHRRPYDQVRFLR